MSISFAQVLNYPILRLMSMFRILFEGCQDTSSEELFDSYGVAPDSFSGHPYQLLDMLVENVVRVSPC